MPSCNYIISLIIYIICTINYSALEYHIYEVILMKNSHHMQTFAQTELST